MKYDAFISYCWKDYKDDAGNPLEGNIISRITKALSDNGLTYWIDEEGISVGDEFPEILYDNIIDSGCLIFISTYNSNHVSKWTSKEISLAIEKKKRIIPVICDKSPLRKGISLLISDVDRIDLTLNPDDGLKEIAEVVSNNKQTLEIEEAHQAEQLRKSEEELAKKHALEKAAAEAKETLDSLLKIRNSLRKELSRLQGEYSLICKDYSANNLKISDCEKVLLNSGQKVAHSTPDSPFFDKDIDGLISICKASAAAEKHLKEEIEHLEETNRLLNAELESSKERKKPAIMHYIIATIAGMIAGAIAMFAYLNKPIVQAEWNDIEDVNLVEPYNVFSDSCMTQEWLESHVSKNGYVDMGTSVLWAARNYGSIPEIDISKTDHKFTWEEALDIKLDDPKTSLPSIDMYKQLRNICEIKSGRLDGVIGMYFVSRITGKCIFFPAFGRYKKGVLTHPDRGAYWSSTPSQKIVEGDSCSFSLIFDQKEIYNNDEARNNGISVRLIKQR